MPKQQGTATGNNTGQPNATGMQNAQTQGATGEARVEGRFQIDPRRAADVHQRLISAPGLARADVDVALDVGVVLPVEVRPLPLPIAIVDEYPQFRGYDYVVVRDEVIIVEPRTRRVVEVIGSGPRRQAGMPHTAKRLQLSAEQRELIRHSVRGAQPSSEVEVTEPGTPLPRSVTLLPIPETVVRDVPAVQSDEYVMARGDRIVMVDPQTREVLAVIDSDENTQQ
jgi:hypothetical protein